MKGVTVHNYPPTEPEVIEKGPEGWEERAALQVRGFGRALLRDHSGVLVYEPEKKLPANIGAYAKRSCGTCYGRGFVRRAFGRLHSGEVAWQERACGCTRGKR